MTLFPPARYDLENQIVGIIVLQRMIDGVLGYTQDMIHGSTPHHKQRGEGTKPSAYTPHAAFLPFAPHFFLIFRRFILPHPPGACCLTFFVSCRVRCLSCRAPPCPRNNTSRAPEYIKALRPLKTLTPTNQMTVNSTPRPPLPPITSTRLFIHSFIHPFIRSPRGPFRVAKGETHSTGRAVGDKHHTAKSLTQVTHSLARSLPRSPISHAAERRLEIQKTQDLLVLVEKVVVPVPFPPVSPPLSRRCPMFVQIPTSRPGHGHNAGNPTSRTPNQKIRTPSG